MTRETDTGSQTPLLHSTYSPLNDDPTDLRFASSDATLFDLHERDARLALRQSHISRRLRTLWGREPPYASQPEDEAFPLLGGLYYTWIGDLMLRAAREELSEAVVPLPTRMSRGFNSGRVLSRELQRQRGRRRAWDAYIGTDVRHQRDASSVGVLRWVGYAQSFGGELLAGVEWRTPPTHRVREGGIDASKSPFHNGTVDGEWLFDTASGCADATCERVGSIRILCSMDANGGKGNAPDVPKSAREVPRPMSVARALFGVLGYFVYVQIPAQLLRDGALLAAPVVMQYYIQYLSSPNPTWRDGILLVVTFFLLSLVQSAAGNKATQLGTRAGLTFQNALQAVLFEKCATISRKALAHPEMNVGRIVNMLSEDSNTASSFPTLFLTAFGAPLQLAVSLMLLYRLVDWCAFAGFGVIILFMPLQGFLMTKMFAVFGELARATDARLKAVNEFFSGIRVAKFMSWEPSFIRSIEEKRMVELAAVRKMQHIMVMVSFLTNTIPAFVIAAVFVLYHSRGYELTPAIVFPAISLLGIMQRPFIMFPLALSAIARFFVSMGRITKFLECDDVDAELEDFAEMEDTDHGEKRLHVVHDVSCNNEDFAAEFNRASIAAYTARRLPPSAKARRAAEKTMKRNQRKAQTKKEDKEEDPSQQDASTERNHSSDDVKNSRSSHSQHDQNKKSDFDAATNGDEAFYTIETKVLLHDISLRIPRGKLTCIIGDTGSGKSTLLETLLGDAAITSGSVRSTPSIAYVPQQAWIMNATVRDNILFYSDMNSDRFDRALRCTQLESDLSLFPRGTETEIGERGINLSGGQKARVGLARAVYASTERELFLLDDPLSALDAHVGARVMQECVLGELKNKTRLLATHQLHVLPHADHILVLREGGTIAFSGDYEAYCVFANINESTDTITDGTDTHTEKKTNPNTPESAKMAEEEKQAFKGNLSDLRLDTDDAKTPLKQQEETENDGKLMTDEEKAVGSVPLETYMRYAKACGGLCLSGVILLIFVVAEVIEVAPLLWLSFWSVRTFALETNVYLFVYIGFVAASALCSPMRYLPSYAVMRRGAFALHGKLLRCVAVAPVAFFDTTPLGRVMNRFSKDVKRIDGDLQGSLIFFLQCILSVLSSLAVMASTQYFVLIAIIPCALIYYRLMLFYNSANRETRRIANRSSSPVFSILGETLAGRWTIAAYDKAPHVMAEALRRIDRVYGCSYMQTVGNCWLAVRVELLSNMILTSVAFTGVLVLMLRYGPINVGLVSLSLTMAIDMNSWLKYVVNQSAAVEADMNCVERIFHYTDHIDQEDLKDDIDTAIKAEVEAEKAKANPPRTQHHDEILTNEDNDPSEIATVVVSVGPNGTSSSSFLASEVTAGSIEFRGVQMRYREGLPLVLRDVSFTIPPAQKVGIVGRTGSGKSSMLLTFMRVVEISGGDIIISGRPIRSYRLRELRRLFSMIPQDPVLFNGTLRFNLDPQSESDDAAVWNALELVGMRERVATEAEGLRSRVEEGGLNFSVGQRQLLCMARALLRRRGGFILMDEATANVDPGLDRQIQHTVRHSFAAFTVVTIAHRLHTVATYDSILVMEEGRVVEAGPPKVLVEQQNSRLGQMVRSLGEAALEEFTKATQEVEEI